MSEQNLYEQAETTRSIRYHMVGLDQDALDNPYFRRGRKDLESRHPHPDAGLLCDLHQEALWTLRDSKGHKETRVQHIFSTLRIL